MMPSRVELMAICRWAWSRLQNWLVWARQHSSLRWGINLLLVMAFLIFLAYRISGDWHQLIVSGLAFNPAFFGAAVVLYGANFALFSWVWHSIVLRFGGPRDWRLNVSLYAYTYLAKFLPTPVWFVGGRITAYHQTGMRRRTVVGLTALEVVLHIITGGVVLIGLLFDVAVPLAWLGLLLPLALMVVIGHPRLLHGITIATNLQHGDISAYRRDAVVWLFANVASWGIAGLFAVCVVKALSLPISPSFASLWSAWIAANLIAYLSMFTLGGVGFLRELSLVWFLGKSYSLTTAVLIAAAARLIMTVAGLLWAGLVFGVTRVFFAQVQSFDEPVFPTKEEQLDD